MKHRLGFCFPILAKSHPSWVCGLKQSAFANVINQKMSHPSWVCGLKLRPVHRLRLGFPSHPSWVCGLKLEICSIHNNPFWSHPSWVCGLKHGNIEHCPEVALVTPFVGVWIETAKVFQQHKVCYVTPFVGVWIETRITSFNLATSLGHTLRGCVD